MDEFFTFGYHRCLNGLTARNIQYYWQHAGAVHSRGAYVYISRERGHRWGLFFSLAQLDTRPFIVVIHGTQLNVTLTVGFVFSLAHILLVVGHFNVVQR